MDPQQKAPARSSKIDHVVAQWRGFANGVGPHGVPMIPLKGRVVNSQVAFPSGGVMFNGKYIRSVVRQRLENRLLG